VEMRFTRGRLLNIDLRYQMGRSVVARVNFHGNDTYM
jgi:hypothetical protein